MENIFYLNKDLQPVKYKSDAVAIAHYFKDETSRILYKLGDNRFKKIIEITFFEPIGYNLNQPQSYDAIKKWQEKNYPNYQAFLPSEKICSLIRLKTNKKFDNCWTRSSGNDGPPRHRYYPIVLEDGTFYLGNWEEKAENTYPSLVLTKEEFLKINPDIKLSD